jgi:hypothetical protein
MAEEVTWDEKLSADLSEMVTFLQEMKDKIQEKHDTLLGLLFDLVEGAKKIYEPGLDYYGIDYLNQMGVGLKVKELADIVDPLAYELKLDALIKDAETRLTWMKRDIEKKEVTEPYKQSLLQGLI